MISAIFFFIIGFAILIKGSSLLVDGASSLARRYGISAFVAGLVVVGIGTSIPEFIIVFFGNLLHQEGVGLGTLIGSNIFNILFILGLSAIISPIILRAHWVSRDLVWNILSVCVAIVFIAVPIGGASGGWEISRAEGLFLLVLFAAWLAYSLKKSGGRSEERAVEKLLQFRVRWGIMFAGVLAIFLGGKWVTDSAVAIARALGFSEQFIGLTIVAIGTSFPELTASVTAAFKREPGIVVGNIVGSNIFDFLMILGFNALMQPIPFPRALVGDIVIALIAPILLLAAMFIGRRYELKRWQGFVFVFLYLVYFAYLFAIG